MNANVKFAKIREDAKIPSKRDEDAGFDVYACFDEDYIEIEPHETKIIPTGIASACDKDYCFIIKERGSTGSKGIAVRMGVIDSGYRDGWMVGLTNTTSKSLYISKISKEEIVDNACKENDAINRLDAFLGGIWPVKDNLLNNMVVYPYEKAIAQALVVPVPHTTIEEVTYEELKSIKSERGTGALGSSGK